MNTLRHTDAGYARKLERLCAASSLFDPKIEAGARAIVERVAAKGDAAAEERIRQADEVDDLLNKKFGNDE